LARRIRAREIDRADAAARGHALAVRLALLEIDLVVVADGVFRARPHAGVAARADLEIDRVFLLPFDLERAEPALELRHPAGPHRIFALERKLPALAGDEHADRELRRQPLGPVERRGGRPDDQELAA